MSYKGFGVNQLINQVTCLKLHAKVLKAKFSAVFNCWSVDLEEIEFTVRYLKVEGLETDGRFGATYLEVTAEDVELEWVKNILTVKKGKNMRMKKHHHNLYDPDKPRNLAKSVTVR